MSNQHPDVVYGALSQQEALSRRCGDGRAAPGDESPEPGAPAQRAASPVLGEPELQALHVRVIALESLVIALLAEASEQGRGSARAMASTLVPKPGFVRHALTIRAAARMTDLIDRAVRFHRRRL